MWLGEWKGHASPRTRRAQLSKNRTPNILAVVGAPRQSGYSPRLVIKVLYKQNSEDERVVVTSSAGGREINAS